jgi:hypothetical protein
MILDSYIIANNDISITKVHSASDESTEESGEYADVLGRMMVEKKMEDMKKREEERERYH